ncbi:MAG: radical SAM protein, partial [Oscillospiraceae bacterium]|nr:radical SAM protein [Oscillospiraceae bacterium]
SEANSLLIQVTNGCTWNKCKFCGLYKGTKFKTFSADSIKQDIDAVAYYADRANKFLIGEGTYDRQGLVDDLYTLGGPAQYCYFTVINWLIHGGKNVFLQDGNTLALRDGRLSDVLVYLRQVFPQIDRITSYGRAESLSRISAEEFAELHEAGLTRIHSGFETGSDAVLRFINKGVTSEQQITAGKNIKAGGIELSVYFMPGVGGKELSRENAMGTAHVVSEIDPDFVRLRTAAVKMGSELYDEWKAGMFEICSDDDKVWEIKTLIENVNCQRAVLVSDHIINLLPEINGSLSTGKYRMLGVIDEYLSMPELDRRVYQLLRRRNEVAAVSDLERVSEDDMTRLRDVCSKFTVEDWDERMNHFIDRYI